MIVSRADSAEPGSRKYDAPRRRTKAEANRRSVLKAARDTFVASGFSQTTIEAIASRAAVSPQTVYAVFRSKAGLLLALLDDLERSVDSAVYAAVIDAADDAHEQLRLIVGFHCDLFERGLDLIELARRSSSDPSVGAFVDEGNRRRRSASQAWVARWEQEHELRADLDARTAVDLLWVHCGPDFYAALVLGCGWSRSRVETWLVERLGHLLLAGEPNVGRTAKRPSSGSPVAT